MSSATRPRLSSRGRLPTSGSSTTPAGRCANPSRVQRPVSTRSSPDQASVVGAPSRRTASSWRASVCPIAARNAWHSARSRTKSWTSAGATWPGRGRPPPSPRAVRSPTRAGAGSGAAGARAGGRGRTWRRSATAEGAGRQPPTGARQRTLSARPRSASRSASQPPSELRRRAHARSRVVELALEVGHHLIERAHAGDLAQGCPTAVSGDHRRDHLQAAGRAASTARQTQNPWSSLLPVE
jgi:hypothetical protein